MPTILALLGLCGTIEAMLLVAVRSLEYGARFCALTFATRSQIFASYIYRRQKTYFFNFKTQLRLLHIILIFFVKSIQYIGEIDIPPRRHYVQA